MPKQKDIEDIRCYVGRVDMSKSVFNFGGVIVPSFEGAVKAAINRSREWIFSPELLVRPGQPPGRWYVKFLHLQGVSLEYCALAANGVLFPHVLVDVREAGVYVIDKETVRDLLEKGVATREKLIKAGFPVDVEY
jgi:hypothetical protein